MAFIHLFEYFRMEFKEDDVYLSFLPYAHLFEQGVFSFVMFYGFSIGYYDGNPFKLQEDIAELRPTILITVPRILNRIY